MTTANEKVAFYVSSNWRSLPEIQQIEKMAQNIDVDDTLEAYGYSKNKSGTGFMITLALLLLCAAGGAAFMGKMWSEEHSKNLQTEQAFTKVSKQLSEMEIRNSELSSLVADKQSEIERLRDEWAKQVTELETDHKEQLQRTYAHMNEIVYDSKKTLTYINDIEGRMRTGQKIDRAEAEKLASVINGLSFLHEQYKKPIGEFRELDRYFKKQLDAIPQTPVQATIPTVVATRPDPAESTPVFKRIFNNRKYKEDREAYIEEKGRAQGVEMGRATGINQGKRQALTQAKRVVQDAYSRAQKQMSALALDKNQYLSQLDQLVASKNQSVADVDAFFQKSKKILQIHEQIMNVEPTREPATTRP